MLLMLSNFKRSVLAVEAGVWLLTSIDARMGRSGSLPCPLLTPSWPPSPHIAPLPPLSCDQTLAVVTFLTPGELGCGLTPVMALISRIILAAAICFVLANGDYFNCCIIFKFSQYSKTIKIYKV